MKALEYLRNKEWSMGNGQCPECCGCNPDANWWTQRVGHDFDCDLALAIQELGGTAKFDQENTSPSRFDFEKLGYFTKG